MSNVKVQEIAKDLKLTSKEIITKLAEFDITLKSGASLLEEEHLGLILEIYTQAFDLGDEVIEKPEVKAPEFKEEKKIEDLACVQADEAGKACKCRKLCKALWIAAVAAGVFCFVAAVPALFGFATFSAWTKIISLLTIL